MIRTKAGHDMMEDRRYMGSFLEGPIDASNLDPRGNLRDCIERIESEAVELGRRLGCDHQELHIEAVR